MDAGVGSASAEVARARRRRHPTVPAALHLTRRQANAGVPVDDAAGRAWIVGAVSNRRVPRDEPTSRWSFGPGRLGDSDRDSVEATVSRPVHPGHRNAPSSRLGSTPRSLQRGTGHTRLAPHSPAGSPARPMHTPDSEGLRWPPSCLRMLAHGRAWSRMVAHGRAWSRMVVPRAVSSLGEAQGRASECACPRSPRRVAPRNVRVQGRRNVRVQGRARSLSRVQGRSRRSR